MIKTNKMSLGAEAKSGQSAIFLPRKGEANYHTFIRFDVCWRRFNGQIKFPMMPTLLTNSAQKT